MFGIGSTELLIILVVALMVLGPKKLPQIARTIGKGYAEFKRATTDLQRTINTEIAREEESLKKAQGADKKKKKPKNLKEFVADKAKETLEETTQMTFQSATESNRAGGFKDPYAAAAAAGKDTTSSAAKTADAAAHKPHGLGDAEHEAPARPAATQTAQATPQQPDAEDELGKDDVDTKERPRDGEAKA